jgi:hypothetical protein
MGGWCTLAVAAAAVAGPASAALGEPAASVMADRKALAAEAVSATAAGAYERHELTTPDGTSVREFASPAGGVFAVDFSGPTMPDLKTVLGAHYATYEAAARARRGTNHHVFSFASDGVVMTVTKLPRGFSGRAHLPAAVPAGVDVNDLR